MWVSCGPACVVIFTAAGQKWGHRSPPVPKETMMNRIHRCLGAAAALGGGLDPYAAGDILGSLAGALSGHGRGPSWPMRPPAAWRESMPSGDRWDRQGHPGGTGGASAHPGSSPAGGRRGRTGELATGGQDRRPGDPPGTGRVPDACRITWRAKGSGWCSPPPGMRRCGRCYGVPGPGADHQPAILRRGTTCRSVFHAAGPQLLPFTVRASRGRRSAAGGTGRSGIRRCIALWVSCVARSM